MVCWDPRQTHLQEVGLTQIPTNHVRVKALDTCYGLWIRVNDRGPWLVCEVALRFNTVRNSSDLNNNSSIQKFSHLDIHTKYQYLISTTFLIPTNKVVFFNY